MWITCGLQSPENQRNSKHIFFSSYKKLKNSQSILQMEQELNKSIRAIYKSIGFGRFFSKKARRNLKFKKEFNSPTLTIWQLIIIYNAFNAVTEHTTIAWFSKRCNIHKCKHQLFFIFNAIYLFFCFTLMYTIFISFLPHHRLIFLHGLHFVWFDRMNSLLSWLVYTSVLSTFVMYGCYEQYFAVSTLCLRILMCFFERKKSFNVWHGLRINQMNFSIEKNKFIRRKCWKSILVREKNIFTWIFDCGHAHTVTKQFFSLLFAATFRLNINKFFVKLENLQSVRVRYVW